MIDARLTRNTAGDYDLKFENGTFIMAEDGTEAAQHALIRLLVFRGEPSLNGEIEGKEDTGTFWYDRIWPTNTSKAEKEFEIKRRILQTPGIDSITEFTWSQTAHTVTINGIVKTQWGSLTISDTIEAL